MSKVAYNPYAAPQADLHAERTGDLAEAERVRREYLNHEASVRSVGTLYYIGFVFSALAFLGYLAVAVMTTVEGDSEAGIAALMWGLTLFMGLLTLLYRWLGKGLRALDRRVRVPVGILCAIGLIGFPVGTLISAFILYLIASKKGSMVFSDEYRRVIEQTPHIKYQTATWLKVVLWLVLGLFLVALIAVLMSG